MAWIDSATVATITAPHLLYAFIWFLPGLWRRGFRKPVKAFEIAASLGKVLQIVSVLYWYSEKSKEHGLKLDLIKVPLLQWGAFFLLVFLGQVLNIAVYRRLTNTGVYYGTKLGKKVAWKTGFPFNVVGHPQYVGAVFTIWGLATLVWGQSPPGTITLAVYWTLLYGIAALQEQFL